MNFFRGLFLGAMLGYFAASLCAVAGKDDRNDN